MISYVRPRNKSEEEQIEKVEIIEVEYDDEGKEFLTIKFQGGEKEKLTEDQLYAKSQPDGWYDVQDIRDAQVRNVKRSDDNSPLMEDNKPVETLMMETKWKGYMRKTWEPADSLKEYVPEMLADFIMKKYEPSEKKKKENERLKKDSEIKRWVLWARDWRSKAVSPELTNMTYMLEEIALEPNEVGEYIVDMPPHVIFLSNDDVTDGGDRVTFRESKYGTLLPHKNREKDSIYLDEIEGNGGPNANSWNNAMKRDLEKYFEFETWEFSDERPAEHQLVFGLWVYTVKGDGMKKGRFCVSGNRTDIGTKSSYSSVILLEHARVLVTIAQATGAKVWMLDLVSAYLNAKTEEKVVMKCKGKHWGKHEGKYAKFLKAAYGLKTSGHAFQQLVIKSMRAEGYQQCKYDLNVYMKMNTKSNDWDRVGFYVDDMVIVSHFPEGVQDDISKHFGLTGHTDLTRHLGADYVRHESGIFSYNSSTYLIEVLSTMPEEDRVLMRAEKGRGGRTNTPIPGDHNLEIDDSPLLETGGREHTKYWRYGGIIRWLIILGRIDIAYSGAVLSQFNASPRANQLKAIFRVMSYLEDHPEFTMPIVGDASKTKTLEGLGSMPKHLRDNMRTQYPGVGVEEEDEDDPTPRGGALKMTCYVDSDHAGCKATRRSTYGFIIFLGGTPIFWESIMRSRKWSR